jgi:flagellar motility protein MotE (MotC chaperone)
LRLHARWLTTGRSALQPLSRSGTLLATALLAGILTVAKGIEVGREWPADFPGQGRGGIVSSALAQPQEQQAEPAENTAALLEAAPIEPVSSPASPTLIGDPRGYGILADVAAELSAREAVLLHEESEIAMREAALLSLQLELDDQLARIERYKSEIEELAGLVATRDDAELAQLVKIYENMKAKSAAAVFDGLADEVLLPLARGMREQKLAPILALMNPTRARRVTADLAAETSLPAMR